MQLTTVSVLIIALTSVSLGQRDGVDELADAVDPCKDFRCEAGSVCEPVVNELLQLPVAHCLPTSDDGDKSPAADDCSSHEMGVSVVMCRTELQWMEAAVSRCGFNSRQPSVAVRHPCHRRISNSPSIFLQATITCCPDEAPATTSSEATTHAASSVEQVSEMEEGEGERDGEEKEGEGSKSHTVEVIVGSVGGCAVLVMVTISVLKIVYYCRSRRTRPPYKPKLSFVTAYINPSSEGLVEDWSRGLIEAEVEPDFSYVAANSSTD